MHVDKHLVDAELAHITIAEVQNEHSGAFEEITLDPVKVAHREDVTEALNFAKTSHWDTNTDTDPDVCGYLSNHCVRTRHQSSQKCLPSFAMERFPKLDSSIRGDSCGGNTIFSYQFTKYDTAKHDKLTWEGFRMEVPCSTSIYGTGENTGGLLLNEMADYGPHEHSESYDQRRGIDKKTGKPIPEPPAKHYPRPRNNAICWNTDAVFCDESFESMYQSHPWVLLVKEDGSALGVFVDSTYRTVIHLCKEGSLIYLYFLSEAPKGAPPVYLFPAQTPQRVLQELSTFTGYMKLPPKWALGYQQCRYSYYPDTTVKKVAKTFREKKIPCDVIWMDIHYMDEYKCFTFDKAHFPDPKALNTYLHDNGFKSVWMLDPGIKLLDGYSVYDSGTQGNHWITLKEGNKTPAVGKVWPGKTVFPDFLKQETREWWGDLFKEYMGTGIDGVWNDMNEISSFQDGNSIPQYSYHHADEDLGGPDPNTRYHNVYGMMMAKASYDGIQKADNNKRPFVLTRANFMGGQRYAAMWTGDNTSSWSHLHFSIPMVLNMGLSAQPFAGVDIGGFFENASASLYARWVGIGALLPFARGHSCDGTADHEPWSFGKQTEDTCRRAIERRYRLLPYFYTCFHEASKTGLPVARPVFFTDPTDTSLRAIDDAFVIGEDILVQAFTTPAKEESCVLPAKYQWRKMFILDDPNERSDADLPDLYQRSGSIIPVGPLVQFVDDESSHELDLYVFLGEDGEATGKMYDDAGEGYAYQSGDFAMFEFHAQKSNGEVTVTSKQTGGVFTSPYSLVRVHVVVQEEKQSKVFHSLEFVATFSV